MKKQLLFISMATLITSIYGTGVRFYDSNADLNMVKMILAATREEPQSFSFINYEVAKHCADYLSYENHEMHAVQKVLTAEALVYLQRQRDERVLLVQRKNRPDDIYYVQELPDGRGKLFPVLCKQRENLGPDDDITAWYLNLNLSKGIKLGDFEAKQQFERLKKLYSYEEERRVEFSNFEADLRRQRKKEFDERWEKLQGKYKYH